MDFIGTVGDAQRALAGVRRGEAEVLTDATAAMRLDRHARTLLAPLDVPAEQSPLVAMAYWGTQHLIEDAEMALSLRQLLDEMSQLPNNKLQELLRQSHLPLDQGLAETALGLLLWLADYAQMAD